MRRVILIGLGVLIHLLSAEAAKCEELVLAENGKSPYHIVVAVDASIQDYHAPRCCNAMSRR